MYDLTLERRKSPRRQQPLQTKDVARVHGQERRQGERRNDSRPLTGFPYLPHHML